MAFLYKKEWKKTQTRNKQFFFSLLEDNPLWNNCIVLKDRKSLQVKEHICTCKENIATEELGWKKDIDLFLNQEVLKCVAWTSTTW